MIKRSNPAMVEMMDEITEILLKVQKELRERKFQWYQPSCRRCSDMGTVMVEIDGVSRAKTCRCAHRARARQLLARIPPRFGNPKLSRLKPRPDLHPKQAGLIQRVQQHPDDSYLLLGRNNAGKSHVGWALYRHAISQGRGVVACSVHDLLLEFRRQEMDRESRPRIITADQLRHPGPQRRPWFLFFEEFEKARPSEFAAESLFSLLDVARAFQHQLVVTSNLPEVALRKHWSRQDQIWGNSIMERLKDCVKIELF